MGSWRWRKRGRICNVSLISFHIQMRGVTERRGAVCKCQWNLKASQVEDGTRWLIPKVDVRNCVGFVLTPCKYI